MEDAYEVRNEFVDEDRLHLMAEKLRKRPLLNHIEDGNETLNVCIEPGDEVRITIKGNEPYGRNQSESIRKRFRHR